MSVSYFKTSAQSAFTGVAVTVGPIEWMNPFAGTNAKVMFRQKFQQDIDSWSPISLDTAHGVATTYLLVKEDDFSAIGGGQQTWNRYYACTPPQRVEFTTYAAQFPGMYQIRDPINVTSQGKITYDYFLINNPATVPTLSSESVVTFNSIGFPLLSNNYLNNGGGTLYASNPTLSVYQGTITADTTTAASFSITAEAQSLTRWEGNFYERRTINIKAK